MAKATKLSETEQTEMDRIKALETMPLCKRIVADHAFIVPAGDILGEADSNQSFDGMLDNLQQVQDKIAANETGANILEVELDITSTTFRAIAVKACEESPELVERQGTGKAKGTSTLVPQGLLDFEEVAKTIQEAMKLRFEKEAIHSTTTRDNAVLKRLSQVRSNIIAGVGQGVDITDMETFPSESSLKDATIKARTNAKVAQKADLSDTDKAKEIATDTVRTIFNHSMQSIKDSSLGDEVKAEFKKEVDAQFRALYEEVIAKADILLSPATTNTGDAAPATNEATG